MAHAGKVKIIELCHRGSRLVKRNSKTGKTYKTPMCVSKKGKHTKPKRRVLMPTVCASGTLSRSKALKVPMCVSVSGKHVSFKMPTFSKSAKKALTQAKSAAKAPAAKAAAVRTIPYDFDESGAMTFREAEHQAWKAQNRARVEEHESARFNGLSGRRRRRRRR